MIKYSFLLFLLNLSPGHLLLPGGEVVVASVGPSSSIHSYSMGRYKRRGQHNGFPTFHKVAPLVKKGKVKQKRYLYVDDDKNWAISNNMHTPAVSLYSIDQAKPCGKNKSGVWSKFSCDFGDTWKFYTTDGFKIDRGLKVKYYESSSAQATTVKSLELTTIKINGFSKNSSTELSLNKLRKIDEINPNELNKISISSDEEETNEVNRAIISLDKNITNELKETSRSSIEDILNEPNISMSNDYKINIKNTSLSPREPESISSNEVENRITSKDKTETMGNERSEALQDPRPLLKNENKDTTTMVNTSEDNQDTTLVNTDSFDRTENQLTTLTNTSETLDTSAEHSSRVNVSLSGGAGSLYPSRSGLYKLQPHKSNNFPVWKHQSGNLYIRVESNNMYWTIAKDNWDWQLYLPQNSPTPALPFDHNCWFVKHTVWREECGNIRLIYGVTIAKPPLNQTKAEGETMKMPCEGDSIEGKVSVAWYRGGRRIQNIDRFQGRVKVTKKGTLVISNVNIDDSGLFVCEVSDATGRKERAEAFLDVEMKALVVATPAVQFLHINQPGVISCHFQANPSWTYVKWTKDDNQKEMKVSSSGYTSNALDNYPTSFSSLTNGSIAINSVTAWHAGNYTCKPYNKLGSRGPSGIMQVYVKDPPHVHIGVRCKQTAILLKDLAK